MSSYFYLYLLKLEIRIQKGIQVLQNSELKTVYDERIHMTFTLWASPTLYHNRCAKSLQPCPNLCDPMDCHPPSSSVHEDSLDKKLRWVAMPSSRGIFLILCVSYVSCIGRWVLYHQHHLGSPYHNRIDTSTRSSSE